VSRRGSTALACLFALPLLGLQVGAAFADWPRNPYGFVTVGGPASRVAFFGSLVSTRLAVADGAGGLVVVWPRGASNPVELVAQRLDHRAAPQWGAGAIACDAPGGHLYPVVAPDGRGGVFAFWSDWRDTTGPDVYAQRVAPDGSVQWPAPGVPVCIADQPQRIIAAAPDGQGGVLVAWEDSRDQLRGSSQDVYAQRLDPSGGPLWGSDGLMIATGSAHQSRPRLLPTGDGGAYIAWGANDEVWIQKLGGEGTPRWSAPVRVGVGDAGYLVRLLPDGRGGALVGMSSSRLQRVSGTGALLLGPDGALPAPGSTLDTGVEDGSGGAYWLLRTPDRNSHVIHVDSLGTPSWSSPVTLGTGFVRYGAATLISDGAGGAIATWIDTRSGGPQVYATRIDGSGQEPWGEHGLAAHVGTARKDLVGSVTDGAHGAIVVWNDHDALEIRAQRIDAVGSIQPFVPESPQAVTVAQPTPNPSTGAVLIGFRLARRGHARVRVLDVAGRLVRTVFEGELDAGPHQYSWSGYGADHRRAGRGMYVVLIEALDRRIARRVVMLGEPAYDPEMPR
jgi:hypothetical protein